MTALTHLPDRSRVAILAIISVLIVGVAVAVPPFAQPDWYHDFADKRPVLSLANFADVASNLGYLVAGLAGLTFLSKPGGRTRFAGRWQAIPWWTFFAATVLICFGSGWYHLAPDNGSLVWDRLTMSLAFMALFAGFIGDRINARTGTLVVLPIALLLGAGGVLWWHASETAGAGDLRFYFLFNPALPAMLLLAICAMWPGRLTDTRGVVTIALWYGAAMACEQLDHEIFTLTGGAISGHTIKHLLSAGAVLAVAAMLRRVPRADAQPVARVSARA